MNIITVIPARGGSKSIPMKNIKRLGGKPLVWYSIQYSLKCQLISHTVVSTDSEKIAEISLQCGAEVPFIRPSRLSMDDTPDYPVFRHALDTLESVWNVKIDTIILLRPTSPLRSPGLIERGIDLLRSFPDATSVRSVTLSREHPYRQWRIEGDYMVGYEEKVFEPYNLERQKLPTVYFQTGDIEIIRRETLLDGSISGNRVLPLLIKHEEMVDIDYESDFKEAEKKLVNSENT